MIRELLFENRVAQFVTLFTGAVAGGIIASVLLVALGMMAMLHQTIHPIANSLVGLGVYMVFAIPPLAWYPPMLLIPSAAIVLAAYIYQGM